MLVASPPNNSATKSTHAPAMTRRGAGGRPSLGRCRDLAVVSSPKSRRAGKAGNGCGATTTNSPWPQVCKKVGGCSRAVVVGHEGAWSELWVPESHWVRSLSTKDRLNTKDNLMIRRADWVRALRDDDFYVER